MPRPRVHEDIGIIKSREADLRQPSAACAHISSEPGTGSFQGSRLLIITFHNIAITFDVGTARESYDDLCGLFDLYDRAHGGGAISWETDTYSVDGGPRRSTAELSPRDG